MREEPQLIRKLRLVAGTLFWGVAWLIHHRDKRTPASRYPDVPKVTVEGERTRSQCATGQLVGRLMGLCPTLKRTFRPSKPGVDHC
jgi:hypothetical protein